MNLEPLDLICEALDCRPEDLIVQVPNESPKAIHAWKGTLVRH